MPAQAETGTLPYLARRFSDADLGLVRDVVLAACDADDGAAVGVVGAFRQCTSAKVLPELRKRACSGGKAEGCLIPAQIDALQKIHEGPRDGRGEALYASFPWDGGWAGRDWRGWKIGSPSGMPSINVMMGVPALAQMGKLTGDKKSRVYELRSYESPTEKLYRTKVKMFNVGDEVGIFNRLGFNAIFYAEVLAGKKMPNLMYMTSFESMEERDAHWKAFGSDPEWEKLKADKQYDNTVSHIDITFLYPAEYSDL